jgi:hypothetical protein
VKTPHFGHNCQPHGFSPLSSAGTMKKLPPNHWFA